ncbi:MAG: hypothetical protein AABY26_01205 [Nanoarchaeota archaeon]
MNENLDDKTKGRYSWKRLGEDIADFTPIIGEIRSITRISKNMKNGFPYGEHFCPLDDFAQDVFGRYIGLAIFASVGYGSYKFISEVVGYIGGN